MSRRSSCLGRAGMGGGHCSRTLTPVSIIGYSRLPPQERPMIRFVIAACALALGVTGAAHAQPKAKYTAKIGHLEAPTQPRHQGLIKVAELVKSRTNGEVEFQLFPSSQLGNARQMIEGTQLGTSEGTVMPAAFLGGFNPAVSILDIPFLFPSDRVASQKLREGAFGKTLLDSFYSRGFIAIALC